MTPALLVSFLVKSKPNRVIVRGERPANHTDTPLKFYKIYDNHFDIVRAQDDGNVFTNEQVTDYLKYRRCLGADVSLLGI